MIKCDLAGIVDDSKNEKSVINDKKIEIKLPVRTKSISL